MKAVCYNGVGDLRTERVPDPTIINPKDAILRVILSSVCGSDLHLLNGYVPTMREGDIIGHEFMGEVVEIGSEVKKLKKGDRVVVCSILGCGECQYCQSTQWSLCDNSNPHAWIPEKVYGDSPAGIFGYSHAFGGYAGSHADYIRVPYADRGCFVIPEGLPDEAAVFASDALPTGFMAADIADIQPGNVVAIWGCGGVGQMAIQSAFLLGASRVIAIDREPDRLRMAKDISGADVLDFSKVDIQEALREMTGGRGPDRCIDCVGMEAVSEGLDYYYDKTKQFIRLESDRPIVLREAILACRKGGTVSIIGVYGGLVDSIPMGAAMNKALTFRMGQQHGQRYIPRLLEHLQKGELNSSFMLTHKMSLDEGMAGYDLFNKKKTMRVVFAPQ